MRRLPIFLLLDVSESMAGENLRLMQEGLDQLVRSLRRDPYALETAYLCVIGFAGKARTLAPLVELVHFYPPHLPLASGTSLGLAMTHLMDEMDQQVHRTTPEAKGDWRPIVFLLTDGKPTDDIEPALKRWQRDYAGRATLVGVGIGRHAALAVLQRFTETVLLLDAQTPADFRQFIDWVSRSVSAHSRSLATQPQSRVSLAKTDDSILRKIEDIAQAATVDEDYVIITGRCQSTRLPYLMKYDPIGAEALHRNPALSRDTFLLSGVYAAEKDYDELSDPRALARTISTEHLIGAPGCPHCGNPVGMAMCSCGQVFCVSGEGEATCPGCGRQVRMQRGEGSFDVSRARG